MLSKLLSQAYLELPKSSMQKQSAGGKNCELFAVATCMALLL